MIETNRLILRLMNENDIDDILKIFTDKNVMKSFDLQSFDREQMKKWVDRNLNHQNKYFRLHYTIDLYPSYLQILI